MNSPFQKRLCRTESDVRKKVDTEILPHLKVFKKNKKSPGFLWFSILSNLPVNLDLIDIWWSDQITDLIIYIIKNYLQGSPKKMLSCYVTNYLDSSGSGYGAAAPIYKSNYISILLMVINQVSSDLQGVHYILCFFQRF